MGVKMRVGIIGLGNVSDAHLQAYSSVDGVNVVAAAEPNQERLRTKTVKYGLRPYSDFKEMLRRESLDIACILAPVSLHREITLQCAKRGVHVLCEKPMAISLEDAREMVRCCRERHVKFFYGASYRYLPTIQQAKKLISEGAIGDVLLITEAMVGGRGIESHVPMGREHYPLGGPGGSGYGLVDHGVHLIDLIPWLVNSEISSVFGRGNIAGAAPSTEFAYIHLENGAIGHLIFNDLTFDLELPTEGIFSDGDAWCISGYMPANTWHESPGCIRVYGTKGALRIYHYANYLFLRCDNGLRRVRVNAAPAPAHFGYQLESLVRSIQRNESCEATGEDGIAALRALLAIYESTEKGKVVSIVES